MARTHRRDRGSLLGAGGAAAHLDRDHGARCLHCRPRRQHRFRRRQSGPADRLVGRGFFASAPFSGPQSAQYYRPSRAGYKGGRGLRSAGHAAGLATPRRRALVQFRLPTARSTATRTRTALALAVQYPHIAVDLSAARMHRRHHRRRAAGADNAPRECLPTKSSGACPGHGHRATGRVCAKPSLRRSAGSPTASSIWSCCRSAPTTSIFSGLVADVIVDAPTEAGAVSAHRRHRIGRRFRARALERDLPQGFQPTERGIEAAGRRTCRAWFYVSYANPTLADDVPCAGGAGPASIYILRSTHSRSGSPTCPTTCKTNSWPQLKAIALCQGGVLCRDPGDRMTFVDAHQATLRRSWILRARAPKRSGIRSGMFFRPRAKSFDPDIVSAGGATDAVRAAAPGNTVPIFRAAPRWIRDRQRQLLRGDDLSASAACFQSARRYSRRDLGYSFGRLWRARCTRRPKATPRWRMPLCRPPAAVLHLDAAEPEVTARAADAGRIGSAIGPAALSPAKSGFPKRQQRGP